jgi:hypothetical protein
MARVIAQGGGACNLVHQSQTLVRPEAHAVAIARLRSTTGDGAKTRSRS